MGLVEACGLLSFQLLELKVSSRRLRNDENQCCHELPKQGLEVGRLEADLGHQSPRTTFLRGQIIHRRIHFHPRRTWGQGELVDLVDIVRIGT